MRGSSFPSWLASWPHQLSGAREGVVEIVEGAACGAQGEPRSHPSTWVMVVRDAGPLSRCAPQINGGHQPILGQGLPRLCLGSSCYSLPAAQQSLPVLWPRGELVLPLQARETEALVDCAQDGVGTNHLWWVLQ